MVTQPTILKEDSEELQNLTLACKMFEKDVPICQFKIKNVYFDMGQNWMWTNIIAYGSDGSWQLLNPRDWCDICNANSTSAILDVVNSKS